MKSFHSRKSTHSVLGMQGVNFEPECLGPVLEPYDRGFFVITFEGLTVRIFKDKTVNSGRKKVISCCCLPAGARGSLYVGKVSDTAQ